MNCGREPRGLRTEEHGVCIAASFHRADGFLGGKNGGRACSFINGTLCTGEVDGTSQNKMKNCKNCNFFKLLQNQHGSEFNQIDFSKYVLEKSFEDVDQLRSTKGQTLLQNIVRRDGMSLPIDSTFQQLLALMSHNTNGVAVILKGEKPVAIITERDVVRMMYQKIDPAESIHPFVKKNLVHAKGTRTLSYALSLMLENNIRRLIVSDEDNCFQGVVTQKDILKHMEDDFPKAALKIKHILDHQRALVTVGPQETVLAVLEQFIAHNISSVPVLEDGHAIGIITEKDILRMAKDQVPLSAKVETCMSSPVYCVESSWSVTQVVQEMNLRNIRRVVVNDESGKASKILTSRDFVQNLDGDYNEFLELKLKYSKEILNLLPEMFIELIDQGDEQLILWANDNARNVFGEGILDKPISVLVPEKRWREIHYDLHNKTKIGNVRFEKGTRVYEFSGYYLRLNKKNERGRIQLIIRDITDEVIEATTDPLTNAFNRRYINDFMAKESERSKRLNLKFSIAIADIDDFKKINDQHGHPVGDEALTAFTDCIQSRLRGYDVLGRYGGEEFLVVMPELEKDPAASVVERIRKGVEDLKIRLEDDRIIRLTASFGIASYPEDGDSPKDLLIKADRRLYRAKSQGKNQVVS